MIKTVKELKEMLSGYSDNTKVVVLYPSESNDDYQEDSMYEGEIAGSFYNQRFDELEIEVY